MYTLWMVHNVTKGTNYNTSKTDALITTLVVKKVKISAYVKLGY